MFSPSSKRLLMTRRTHRIEDDDGENVSGDVCEMKQEKQSTQNLLRKDKQRD